jgi:hypothetical protein
MNACCGHGDIDDAYVQFWDLSIIRGEDAKIIQSILKNQNLENYENPNPLKYYTIDELLFEIERRKQIKYEHHLK